MAEEVGFEPTNACATTFLAGRPLNHLSTALCRDVIYYIIIRLPKLGRDRLPTLLISCVEFRIESIPIESDSGSGNEFAYGTNIAVVKPR